MKTILALAALALPGLIGATPVVTVSCSLESGAPITYSSSPNSASCAGGANDGRTGLVSANGQVMLSLASDPGAYSVLTANISAFAQQGNPAAGSGTAYGPGGSSTVSIQYDASVLTAGPQRQGYVKLDYLPTGEQPYDGMGSITAGLTINPLLTNSQSPLTLVKCDPNANCNVSPIYFEVRNPLIPVTLGAELDLEVIASFINQAGGPDGQSGGGLGITYDFRFVESDGLTPVAVTAATPEPRSLLLLGFGALLLFGSKLPRRLFNGAIDSIVVDRLS